jgi:hypothetical protein
MTGGLLRMKRLFTSWFIVTSKLGLKSPAPSLKHDQVQHEFIGFTESGRDA